MTAETILLGSMLASDASAWDLRPKLRAEMFTDPWRRSIFATICGLMDEGKRATIGLVAGRIGYEREDGQSVPVLLAIMVGEADDAPVYDFLDELVTQYRLRAFRDALKAADKIAGKDGLDAAIAVLTPSLDDLAGNQLEGPVSVQTLVKTVIRTATSGAKSGGLTTGIREIDDILGPMRPGNLIALGGAPQQGKTVLGAQIAAYIALSEPVLFIENEMKDIDLVTRLLSARTGMSTAQVSEGELTFEERDSLLDAQDAMQSMRLDIWAKPGNTVEQIKMRAASDKRTKGTKVLVLDHLRLIGASRPKLITKWDRYEYVTMELKKLALDLDMIVIMLSQVTKGSQRDGEGAPSLTDLDGGGALEQDADKALILFRKDKWILKNKLGGRYPPRDGERTKIMDEYFDCEGITQVHNVKNRSGESGGIAKLRLRGKQSRFEGA